MNSLSNIPTSILILSRDRLGLIKACLESLEAVCGNFEILLGDTGSTHPNVWSLYEDWAARLAGRFNIHRLGAYHFSKNNNELARNARGTNLVFLNNDTEGIGDWLSPLIERLRSPGIGIAGSKLLFGHNKRIQHASIEFLRSGELKYLGYHPYQHRHPAMPEINIEKYVPAVTGACLAVTKSVFDDLGGFDESFVEEAQDVDLCLKARRKGLAVVYVPSSILLHCENGTRPRMSSNSSDRKRFVKRWSSFIRKNIFSAHVQSEAVALELRERFRSIPHVLFQRQRARGDVFASTALVAKFKEENPDTHITYRTDHPELVDALPFIDRTLHYRDYDDYQYDRVLSLTYENGEWKNHAHTWIEEMGRGVGIQLADYRPKYQFTEWDESVVNFYRETGIKAPYVVLASGAGWGEREWNQREFDCLSEKLTQSGVGVFQIGGSGDHWIRGAHHLLDRGLHENLAIVKGSMALVTVDSFPYHLGLAVGVPIYLLTCKSCSHTVWANELVTEIRNSESMVSPLPLCRSVGCREKFGEGMGNTCSAPILKAMGAEKVWNLLKPTLMSVIHVS